MTPEPPSHTEERQTIFRPHLSPSPSLSTSTSTSTLTAPFSLRKSGPVTGTTKGEVTAALQNEEDSSSEGEEEGNSTTRPDLSRRIGSAMNSLVIGDEGAVGGEEEEEGQSEGESVGLQGDQPDEPKPTTQDNTPSPKTTQEDILPRNGQGQDTAATDTRGQGQDTTAADARDQETRTSPPFWSTWTSKAANGSLTMLRQGTSAAAAGLGSAVRVSNPFWNSAGGEAGTSASANINASNQPLNSAKPANSDDEDAQLIRSAAASLRKGAKDEEKRRRAQGRGRSEVSSATAKTTRDPTPATSASASTSRASSPAPSLLATKGMNVVDYTSTPSCAPPSSEDLFPERRYFVLTQAGKPVFLSHLASRRLAREEAARTRLKTLREGKRRRQEWREDANAQVRKALDEEEQRAAQAEEDARRKDALESDRDEEDSAVQVGVLQALVSNYSSQGVEVLESKSIEILELPQHSSRVVYLLKEPLYLAVTSTWHDAGEVYADSTSLLKAHLDILHAGLISLISESQLQRLFARGFNFDLRRMLEGTDGILSALVARCQDDFGLLLGAGGGGVCLRPTRMDLKLREDLGCCLSLERWENRPLSASATTVTPREAPPRPKDLLYVLLVSSDGQLITMLRPRKLSAYPLDLHLLLNTINGMSRRSARESGTVNWIPICLPRFAPQGMVQAHVSWLNGGGGGGGGSGGSGGGGTDDGRLAECALVIVTADRESFEEISKWRDGIVEALTMPTPPSPSPLHSLSNQLVKSPISPDILHLPGLRQFVLKKKDDLQVVSSEWVDVDGDNLTRERIRRNYARAREACLSKKKKLTTHYIQTPYECIYVDCPRRSSSGGAGNEFGPYELFLTFSPHVPPLTARKIAREVLRWGLGATSGSASERWRIWMGRGSVW